MIKLTTLDQRKIVVNADLIERLEHVPETMITLVSGKKFMVQETMDEIVKLVVEYRQNCKLPVKVED